MRDERVHTSLGLLPAMAFNASPSIHPSIYRCFSFSENDILSSPSSEEEISLKDFLLRFIALVLVYTRFLDHKASLSFSSSMSRPLPSRSLLSRSPSTSEGLMKFSTWYLPLFRSYVFLTRLSTETKRLEKSSTFLSLQPCLLSSLSSRNLRRSILSLLLTREFSSGFHASF